MASSLLHHPFNRQPTFPNDVRMVRVANVQLHGYPIALLQLKKREIIMWTVCSSNRKYKERSNSSTRHVRSPSRSSRNANYKCEKINFDKERHRVLFKASNGKIRTILDDDVREPLDFPCSMLTFALDTWNMHTTVQSAIERYVKASLKVILGTLRRRHRHRRSNSFRLRVAER